MRSLWNKGALKIFYASSPSKKKKNVYNEYHGNLARNGHMLLKQKKILWLKTFIVIFETITIREEHYDAMVEFYTLISPLSLVWLDLNVGLWSNLSESTLKVR